MITSLDVVLSAIDEAYDRRSWHGTNLRGSLRRVTAQQALWRPGEERHNVWELALHAAYWKYAVRRRLRGEKRGSFALKGSNWFAAPARAEEREWRDVLTLLDREHRSLRQTIAALPARALEETKTRHLLTGIAAHDL